MSLSQSQQKTHCVLVLGLASILTTEQAEAEDEAATLGLASFLLQVQQNIPCGAPGLYFSGINSNVVPADRTVRALLKARTAWIL